jgi:hypothetical protein
MVALLATLFASLAKAMPLTRLSSLLPRLSLRRSGTLSRRRWPA